MHAIEGRDISFRYAPDLPEALSRLDFSVSAGEWVAILGCNGSGKSTLLRHLNALLPLQRGSLVVAGIDVRDGELVWQLRRHCGMVFQNPDNQFVSPLLQEDIAFGLANYDTPPAEIPARADTALRQVGLPDFGRREVHTLSGGQKQRAALAGILALQPDIILFDEVTAMLDPEGRQEILEQIGRLHREGKTIVTVTHYAQEAVSADRVCLMREGRLLAQGTPREILTNSALMKDAALLPPLPVRLHHDLCAAGRPLARCPLTEEELVEQLCR